MDCQKFELIVTDFARESLMDIRTLKSAILHAEICPPCARRLAHERRLSAVLQTVAADGVNEGAPARVEANLLNAFRAQYAKQTIASTPTQSVAPTTSNVVPFLSYQPRVARNSWKHLTIGAALAACLALFFVIVPRALRQTPATTPMQQAENATGDIQPAPMETALRAVDVPQVDLMKTTSTTDRIAKNPRPHHTYLSNTVNFTRRANIQRGGVSNVDASSENETATDFLILTPTTSDALEGGQIVRVELPHSALAAFGLPFNTERANERVKADVVLSADGVARAIRFVR